MPYPLLNINNERVPIVDIQTYGAGPQYMVQVGFGLYESFRWMDRAEFLFVQDAVTFIEALDCRINDEVRIVTCPGRRVIWSKQARDSMAPRAQLASYIDAESVRKANILVRGNLLGDTIRSADQE